MSCCEEKHYARGMCKVCYNRALRRGELKTKPKARRSWDVVEDFEFIRQTCQDSNMSMARVLELAAPRMGTTPGALKYKLWLRKQWEAE